MATYYCAPTGSGNGLTSGTPWGGFYESIAKLSAGDTLNVLPGVYTYGGSILTASKSGTSGSRITIQASDTGNLPIIKSTGTFSGSYVTWKNIRFQEPPGGTGGTHTYRLSGTTGVRFEGCVFEEARAYAILLMPSSGPNTGFVFTGCTFRNNHGYSGHSNVQDHLIYCVARQTNGLIEHSLFQNSPNGRGLKFGPSGGSAPMGGVTVDTCRFDTNRGYANITFTGTPFDITIQNSIFSNGGSTNLGNQQQTGSPTNCHLIDCELYSPGTYSASMFNSVSGVTGSAEGAPPVDEPDVPSDPPPGETDPEPDPGTGEPPTTTDPPDDGETGSPGGATSEITLPTPAQVRGLTLARDRERLYVFTDSTDTYIWTQADGFTDGPATGTATNRAIRSGQADFVYVATDGALMKWFPDQGAYDVRVMTAPQQCLAVGYSSEGALPPEPRSIEMLIPSWNMGTGPSGVYRSIDAGATWALVENPGAPGVRWGYVVAAPGNPDRWLLQALGGMNFVGGLLRETSTNLHSGFWITNDSGQTWTAITGGAISGYSYCEAMTPPSWLDDENWCVGSTALAGGAQSGAIWRGTLTTMTGQAIRRSYNDGLAGLSLGVCSAGMDGEIIIGEDRRYLSVVPAGSFVPQPVFDGRWFGAIARQSGTRLTAVWHTATVGGDGQLSFLVDYRTGTLSGGQTYGFAAALDNPRQRLNVAADGNCYAYSQTTGINVSTPAGTTSSFAGTEGQQFQAVGVDGQGGSVIAAYNGGVGAPDTDDIYAYYDGVLSIEEDALTTAVPSAKRAPWIEPIVRGGGVIPPNPTPPAEPPAHPEPEPPTPGPDPINPDSAAIQVWPRDVQFPVALPYTFEAVVSDPALEPVTWSVESDGATIGAIDASTGVFDPAIPSSEIDVRGGYIVATSTVDATKRGRSRVTVFRQHQWGVVPNIRVNPSRLTIRKGDTVTIYCSYGQSFPPVTWELLPGIGTVVDGVYTAPNVATEDTVVAKAPATPDALSAGCTITVV